MEAKPIYYYNYDRKVELILTGNHPVGKTSIREQFVNGTFSED